VFVWFLKYDIIYFSLFYTLTGFQTMLGLSPTAI